MGAPMARCLVAAGHRVALFDLNRQAIETLAGEHEGFALCDDLATLGRASAVVITMLPDSKVVRRVVLGGDGAAGVAEGLAAGALIVDMSSSAPTDTQALGADLATHGIDLVDAPVSGGCRAPATAA